MQFQVGDYIIYGREGVCRVSDIGPAPIGAVDSHKTYYTLKPAYHGGVIYAPIDVSVPMRPILTKQQAWDLIYSIPQMPSEFNYVDAKHAPNEYQSFLQTYDCSSLLYLIRMIYTKNASAIAMGRSFGQTDDKFLRLAKELLHNELAVSLDISPDEVKPTILRALTPVEQKNPNNP